MPWLVLGAALTTGWIAAGTWAQESPIPSRLVATQIDSGVLTNGGGNDLEVVWATVVEVPDAVWLRLRFETADLSFDPVTGASSIIRITSLADGARQHLSNLGAQQWRNTSAYFNGDAVAVELLALPGGEPNRVTITEVVAGEIDPNHLPESICGPTDDRLPSDDPRSGRVMPNGCSAWMFDDPHHTMSTAGHCADFPSDLQTIEFNVPLSTSGGAIQHPPPEDQYAVDQDSRQARWNGVGFDWAYYGCFRNTETGLTPLQAQGDFYLTKLPHSPGGSDEIRITGYGTVSSPINPQWNQIQKTHVGPYVGNPGTALDYQTDTTGGNSGSPVIFEATDEVIGVHTHGGCSFGSNHGTGLNNSDWQNALANPKGICAPFDLQVDPLTGGQMGTFRVSDPAMDAPFQRVYLIYSRSGTGSHFVSQLGVTLGISQPVLATSKLLDANGEATITKNVPSAASGLTVWIQAARAGRTSNVVQSRIN